MHNVCLFITHTKTGRYSLSHEMIGCWEMAQQPQQQIVLQSLPQYDLDSGMSYFLRIILRTAHAKQGVRMQKNAKGS